MSPAPTQEGRGEMPTTLQQLIRRYDRPCIPLAAVAAEYLPHIGSHEHLMREIREGRIGLRYTRLHASSKAEPVVFLADLAAWLDSHNPHHHTAAQDRAA